MSFFTHNVLWKLLALAAAFGVWLNVSNEPDLATIVSVPVQYNHFPKDLEISSDIVETIDLEARGPSGQLRNLNDSRIAAIIDFATVNGPGVRTFTVTPAQLKLPRGIELVRTIPAQLQFKFEKKTTRSVPVEVPFSGHLPDGLTVAEVDIDPPQLIIAGPESHVLGSGELIADPFDLSKAGVTQTLSVYAAEPEVRIVSAPQVKVKVQVQQRNR